MISGKYIGSPESSIVIMTGNDGVEELLKVHPVILMSANDKVWVLDKDGNTQFKSIEKFLNEDATPEQKEKIINICIECANSYLNKWTDMLG